MKQALLFGCGSKNGIPIIDSCLDTNYHVTNIGSSAYNKKEVTNIQIKWQSLDIPFLHKTLKFNHKIDFVFFNQNVSSLDIQDFKKNRYDTLSLWKQIKDWTNSYWLSCQLPFITIHTIQKNLTHDSKIGWMLSNYINFKQKDVENYPDYSSNKYTNYLIMKNFGQQFKAKTFGINPQFTTNNSSQKLYQLITDILNNKQNINGQMFEM